MVHVQIQLSQNRPLYITGALYKAHVNVSSWPGHHGLYQDYSDNFVKSCEDKRGK